MRDNTAKVMQLPPQGILYCSQGRIRGSKGRTTRAASGRAVAEVVLVTVRREGEGVFLQAGTAKYEQGRRNYRRGKRAFAWVAGRLSKEK